MEYVLEVENISKQFPGVKALSGVSFQLKKGEVHALIGENGAGKSTLMKILTGIYKPDSGTIRLKGKEFLPDSPKHAQENGINMIYQELNLVPDLTVAENIFIAHEPRKLHRLLIDDKKMNRDAQALLDSLQLKISPTKLISQLSVAEQQMVEITKSLIIDLDILILDEPTSALSEHEVQKLFSIIRKLCQQGVSIIYISHRLEEFDSIVDRVTVMRDGQWVATDEWKNLSIPRLISLMVGRSITDQYPERNAKIGEIALEAKNLKNRRLKEVSLNVRSGEVLGIAGLMGAGRTEFARAIFGADAIESGEIYIRGEKVKISNPSDAVEYGIAYLPEDRKKDGLMLDLSVDANILSVCLPSLVKHGLIDEKKCRDTVEKKINELDIKTPSAQQIVQYLSGGNQQKVLISRWLCNTPTIVIFDEPTRGIDVGAKYEVYSFINKVAETGAAVIMISSEMPEILGMSDRILIMCEGEVTGEIERCNATQEKILSMASKVDIEEKEER